MWRYEETGAKTARVEDGGKSCPARVAATQLPPPPLRAPHFLHHKALLGQHILANPPPACPFHNRTPSPRHIPVLTGHRSSPHTLFNHHPKHPPPSPPHTQTHPTPTQSHWPVLTTLQPSYCTPLLNHTHPPHHSPSSPTPAPYSRHTCPKPAFTTGQLYLRAGLIPSQHLSTSKHPSSLRRPLPRTLLNGACARGDGGQNSTAPARRPYHRPQVWPAAVNAATAPSAAAHISCRCNFSQDPDGPVCGCIS